MSDPLLTYDLATDPDPLQASPTDVDPSLANLTIIVSNPGGPVVECESISFSFLEGTNAKDFFSDSSGIGTTPPAGWTINQDGSVFTAKPDTPEDGRVGGAGLAFEFLKIKVNDQPGTSHLTITEDASQSGSATPAPAVPRTTIIKLYKFPPHFQVSDLQVSPPPPIEPGGSVTLIWSGSSGAIYELRYEGADGNTVTITHPKGEPNQPLPSSGSYTIENLLSDTTFYLDVTVTVPGQDASLPVERPFTVTVSHLQPKISLFTARIKCVSSAWKLILNWDTTNADYCTLNVDAHRLNPSSTDNSYMVDLQRAANTTYTLTAINSVGSDTSQINVDWQLQMTGSAQVTGSAKDVAVSPDDTRIYVINHDASLLIQLNAATLAPIGNPVSVSGYPENVAVSPDGTRVYVVSSLTGALSVFNAQTLATISVAAITINSSGLAVSPDGTRLYVLSLDNNLRIYDSERLQIVGNPVPIPGDNYQGIAAMRDGTRILVITAAGLLMLDANSLQVIGNPTPLSGFCVDMAFSPDGDRLYVASSAGFFNRVFNLLILDGRTLQQIASVALGDNAQGIACSSSDPRTYVVCDDGMLHVFSEATVTGGKQGSVTLRAGRAPEPFATNRDIMSEMLLSYHIATDPDPLQASPANGDPSLANLTIIVSNPGSKVVECESLSFSFDQGTSAKDFFSDSKDIGSAAPEGWSIQADGSSFTAKPDTPAQGKVGGAGLAFKLLKIKVNEQPGTTNVTITEKINTGSAEKTFELAKFPAEFSLSEIGLQPIPPITGGGSITLSWAGSSDGSYQIQYEDADENTVTITHVKGEPKQPLPPAGSYTIENLMKDPTIFYLIATVPVSGEDKPLTTLRERSVSVELTEVEATEFTVTPNLIVAEPGSFPVTLNWETTAATKLLIDNQEVTGQSTTRTVTETTAFTLEADGYKGPKYLSAKVVVKEPPVEVTDFRANPQVVYGANNNVPVELTWETAHAQLVLLNDNIVDTQSANEIINQTTTFTLKATGNEGPSIKQVTIPVEDPNLTVGQTGDGRVSATFGANPAHYSVRFTFHYPPQNVVDPDTGELRDYHADQDVEGQGQVVTVVGDPIGNAKTVSVTVTGFAAGPITVSFTPPSPQPRPGPGDDPSPLTPMG